MKIGDIVYFQSNTSTAIERLLIEKMDQQYGLGPFEITYVTAAKLFVGLKNPKTKVALRRKNMDGSCPEDLFPTSLLRKAKAKAKVIHQSVSMGKIVCQTDDNGDKYWRLNGELHRTDGPAIELTNGSKYWYLNGKHHREDGPATEYHDGTKAWYLNDKEVLEIEVKDKPICTTNAAGDKRWCLNGELHRVDGPALELVDGTFAWYLKGQYHRTDGPAVEYAHGTKYWYKYGKFHREDGPAKEFNNGDKFWYLNGKEVTEEDVMKDKPICTTDTNGTKRWYLNGELHRENGPAVEYASGNEYWYVNGKEVAEKETHKLRGKIVETKPQPICETDSCGTKRWTLNGELHREDGPALEGKYQKVWYLNGELHRTDGPADVYYYHQNEWFEQWYLNGKRHRVDGPAIVYSDRNNEYWINGKRVTLLSRITPTVLKNIWKKVKTTIA